MRANSFTRFGLAVAAVTCLLDQASKLYLLKVVDLAANGPLRMGPFFDFVLTRNTGISYGLFQTEGAFGQAVLLAIKALGGSLALGLADPGAQPADRAGARPHHRRGCG